MKSYPNRRYDYQAGARALEKTFILVILVLTVLWGTVELGGFLGRQYDEHFVNTHRDSVGICTIVR